MYKIGEFVVYGNEGVCIIEDISEINISGSDKGKRYYTLKPVNYNTTVYAPIDTTVYMRNIISIDEVHKLIEEIPSIKNNDLDDISVRGQQEYYKNLLKTHDCIDLLTILVNLCEKKTTAIKNGKKLNQMDDKFMSTAKNLIEDEFSIVLGISKSEVESYVNDRILNN